MATVNPSGLHSGNNLFLVNDIFTDK